MSETCLIVGAGPVGLTLACLLSKYEVPYRIIDLNEQPVIATKAAGLWARTLEALHHLGLAEGLLQIAHRSYGAHMFSGGQERVNLDLSRIPSFYNFITLIPQHKTEGFLLSHLASHGVDVERGVRLVSLEGGKATLEQGGQTRVEEFRYVFGCDGAHSRVRKEIGASFDGDQLAGCWVVGDMLIEGEGLTPDEVSMFVGPQGPVALFALGGGRYRVVANSSEPVDSVTLEFFEDAARQRIPFPTTISDGQHLQVFTIHERQANIYSNGTAFLLGDAAHIHSPAGGQGVNTGMQDAFNLAWKVAQVVRWGSSPSLLESYHQERHPVAKRVLETTAVAIRMVEIKNPIAQKMRSAAMEVVGHLEPIQARLRAGLSQIDVHYPESALNGARGTKVLKPGDRVPDVLWRDALSRPHRLHDLFTHFGWTLISREQTMDLSGLDPSRLRQVLLTRTGESDASRVSDPMGAVAEATGLEAGCHLLVRPDGYLAGAFGAGESGALRDYWHRHCGESAAPTPA